MTLECSSGEEMLTHMSERLKEAGIEFYITRAKFKVTDALKRSGLYERIGEEHFFGKRAFAMDANSTVNYGKPQIH